MVDSWRQGRDDKIAGRCGVRPLLCDMYRSLSLIRKAAGGDLYAKAWLSSSFALMIASKTFLEGWKDVRRMLESWSKDCGCMEDFQLPGAMKWSVGIEAAVDRLWFF